MLKFDSNHKELNTNIKKRKASKTKQLLVSGILATSILLFSGCAKTVDCDILRDHAHLYEMQNWYSRYIVSEKEIVNSFKRTDEFIYVDLIDVQILEYINKHGLYEININKDTINNRVNGFTNFIEYEYLDEWYENVPRWVDDDVFYFPEYRSDLKWTTNPNEKNLTGNERIKYYVYHGIKLEMDNSGKIQQIKSEPYLSFDEIPEEYNYIVGNGFEEFYKQEISYDLDFIQEFKNNINKRAR